MKKVIATLLTLSVVLALASCGEEPVDNTSSSNNSVASVNSVLSVTSVDSTPVSVPPVSIPDPVNEPTNIALDATPFDSGNDLYDDAHNVDTIIDGNLVDPGYQTKNYVENDAIGLTFDKTYNIDLIVLRAETKYLATFEEDGYDLFYQTADSEDWVALEDVTVDHTDDGSVIVDTITLNEAVEAAAIKLVLKDGGLSNVTNGHKYAPKIYEIEVYEATEEEGETTESAESAESAESTEAESTEAAE